MVIFRRVKLSRMFNLNRKLMLKPIPLEIQSALDQAAAKYTDSPYTTNAGRVLRFVARIIPPSFIIKIFAAKLSQK